MNPKHLHILQHSLGVDQFGRGNQYRNMYVVGPEEDSFKDCQALAAAGLMMDYGPQAMWDGMHGFTVTDAGKQEMLKQSPLPPKRSRSEINYAEFLRADSGLSFIEWLKRRAKLEREKARVEL